MKFGEFEKVRTKKGFDTRVCAWRKCTDCAKVRIKKRVSLHDMRRGRNLEFPRIVEFMDTIMRTKENARKCK